MTTDNEYEYVKGTYKYKKGSTPDRSRETAGAWRGTLRDDDGHLDGQAEFIPGDEAEYDYARESSWTSSYDDNIRSRSEEPSELAQALALVAIHLIDRAVTEVKPLLKRWWNESALPAFRSAQESRRGKIVGARNIDLNAPADGQPRTLSDTGPAVGSIEVGVSPDEPALTMSRSEAQRRLVAAAFARAFSDEQVRILLGARIEDAAGSSDWSISNQATPEEVESQVRLMLESNPSLFLDPIELFIGEKEEILRDPVRHALQLPPQG